MTLEKNTSSTPLASESDQPDGTTFLGRLVAPLAEDFTVSYKDIASTSLSIFLRLTSIVLNVLLAAQYFNGDKRNYFLWTTCCIVTPMVITTMLGIQMYVYDRTNDSAKQKTCIKFVWLVVLCPFLFRYYKSLKYAIKSKMAERQNDLVRQKKYYKYMIEEESDIALIRIFESSLEAAPQKILQISIYLASEDEMTWLQFLAICSCFGSMAWCIVAYHKYNRATQPDKEKISYIGIFLQIMWYFCVYTSRILSIATLASIFPLLAIGVCSIHAFLLSLAVFFVERPTFCSETIFHRIAFAATVGLVFIVTYISLKDVKTFYRYLMYYTLCAIENIVFVGLFFFYANAEFKDSVFFLPLCLVSFSSFYFGIAFMILYYTCFHPNIMARHYFAAAATH